MNDYIVRVRKTVVEKYFIEAESEQGAEDRAVQGDYDELLKAEVDDFEILSIKAAK